MPRRWSLTWAMLGALACCGEAGAHDGHEHERPDDPHLARSLRTWTHASGRFRVRASFVAMHGDLVQVRREHGDLLDIKLKALSDADRAWVDERRAEIAGLNARDGIRLLALQAQERGPARREAPGISRAFRPFADTLKLRWDDTFFYVESNGLPDHRMMVGITAWQQQVPLPQPYTGDNAWRIPLHPVPARRPMSAKENFFRGAIALAVNGVPIFNPIKNDGRTDTYLAGELDEFGGHCGRADDYHYHIAPVHLEAKVGKGQPLAYALDGYPIYGYDEPDGSKPARLDRFNGHEDERTPYHYHASKTYPYLNGGFHGEVTERGGQVDPQPRAEPIREALPPLRGATITEFRGNGTGRNTLTYEIAGRKHYVHYTLEPGGAVVFRFVDARGRVTPETYRRRPGPPGPPPPDEPTGRPPRRGPGPGREARRAPAKTGIVAEFTTNPEGEIDGLRLEDGTAVRFRPGGGDRLRGVVSPKDRVTIRGWTHPGETELHAATIENAASRKVVQVDRPPPELQDDGRPGLSEEADRPRPDRPDSDPSASRRDAGDRKGGFVLRSPAVADGGALPREFTGDGEGVSPPLEWSEAPAGTKSFALIMHHEAPDGIKWYWVLHDIPAGTTHLPKDARDIGTAGNNSINRRIGYAPPHSKGPGEKRYILTLYALSAPPRITLPAGRVGREALLAAMKGLVLGTAELEVTCTREGPSDRDPPRRSDRPNRRDERGPQDRGVGP